MPPKRPTSVLVIAIFHFIFGGLGLCCGLFAAASTVITFASPAMGARGPSGNMAVAQNAYLNAHAPYWKEITLFFNVLDLAISVLMIVAGVGLVQMRRWGRALSLVYGGASIVMQLSRAVYSFVFLLPTLTAFYDSYLASTPPSPETQSLAMIKPLILVSPFLGLIGLIYPVLIVMLQPSVTAAFRGEGVGSGDFGNRPDGDGPLEDDYDRPPPGYGGEPDDRFGSAPP